jgi:hypothetical protein
MAYAWWNNIKMDLQEVGWGGTDSIILAQYKHKWRAHANAVINLRDPYNAGDFLTDDRLSYQEGLCSMELVSLFGWSVEKLEEMLLSIHFIFQVVLFKHKDAQMAAQYSLDTHDL